MTEKRITAAIVRYLNGLKKAGQPVYWLKVHGGPMQRAGTPDLHVTYYGRSYWLEIKTDKGKVTALQEVELAKWSTAGARTAVVRGVEDVERCLSEV